jgi:hypothetical protein
LVNRHERRIYTPALLWGQCRDALNEAGRMRFWLTNRRQSLSRTFHKYANGTTPTPIPSKEGNRTVSVSPPTEGWPSANWRTVVCGRGRGGSVADT